MSTISGPGRTFIGINILFLILVASAISARFYSRHSKRTPIGWDDRLILAAGIVYLGQSTLNFWVAATGGLGYHIHEVTPEQLKHMLMQLTISQFIYAINFVLIRLSICFLFLRIFPQKWILRTVRVAIGINMAWGLLVIISAATVCIPFTYNWKPAEAGKHCHDAVKLNTYIVNAVWTILYDTALWALPQTVIWRLQMPLASKAGLSLIFGLGIFDIIISIVRITAIVKVDLTDVTYTDYPSQVWTVVEISVAIIVACLPVCRVVIERFLRLRLHLFSSNAKSKQTDGVTLKGRHSYEHTAQDMEMPPRIHIPDVYQRLEEQADEIPLSPLGKTPFNSRNQNRQIEV